MKLPEERVTKKVTIGFTEKEYRHIQKVAKRAKLSAREWVRRFLLKRVLLKEQIEPQKKTDKTQLQNEIDEYFQTRLMPQIEAKIEAMKPAKRVRRTKAQMEKDRRLEAESKNQKELL